MMTSTFYKQRSNKNSQNGFTLLELLLSMTLTVLLLSTLSFAMRLILDDWESETSGLDKALDKSLVLLQLEKSLLAAFPHSFVDEERLDRFVFFNGHARELSWVSTVSPQRRSQLTGWKVSSSNVDGITLSVVPAYSDNPQERLDNEQKTVLLPDHQANFYYLLQTNNDEKEWLDEWSGESRQSLPIAVHVVISPINGANGIDGQEIDILAPIKAWQHEDIQPVLPLF